MQLCKIEIIWITFLSRHSIELIFMQKSILFLFYKKIRRELSCIMQDSLSETIERVALIGNNHCENRVE